MNLSTVAALYAFAFSVQLTGCTLAECAEMLADLESVTYWGDGVGVA